MSKINIYKINPKKIIEFKDELKIKISGDTKLKKSGEFEYELFLDRGNNNRSLNWNWVLEEFDYDKMSIESNPKAILLISHNLNYYALCFGHSFFLVDKFSDEDFGFSIARKIDFMNIKTTARNVPNSKRNKSIDSYIEYTNLEFNSGESFTKLKAKVSHNEHDLMSDTMEFGNSIRVNLKNQNLTNIKLLINWIEKISELEDKHNIPICKKIKDEDRLQELEGILENTLIDGSFDILISEFDIVGTDEIFYQNDSEFELKYEGIRKKVKELNSREIKAFIEENNIDNNLLKDIKVIFFRDSISLFSKDLINCIEIAIDDERAFFNNGNWYEYNDDYIKYLNDSINEIEIITYENDDFSRIALEDYQQKILEVEKESNLESIKRKYYKERVYNILKESNEGYELYDRKMSSEDGHEYEVMDLYKNGTIYSVKFGKSSSSLCYAFDQSTQSLKAIQNRLDGTENLNVENVCVWLLLEKNNGFDTTVRPNLIDLKMIMLKNKIDNWKKEVRSLGLKPIIKLNYYIK